MGYYGELQSGELNIHSTKNTQAYKVEPASKNQLANNDSDCVVIDTDDWIIFESRVASYLKRGYKISSSSCNSKSWKAILVYYCD